MKKNKVIRIIIISIAIFVSSFFVIQYSESTAEEVYADSEDRNELWSDRLYVPTMIKKEGDTYFIIDCWNSRILYNDTLINDVRQWKTLTDENYLGGHSIASDGELYVFDNTDMQQLLVYTKDEAGEFILKQIIENVELRPHFVVYHDSSKIFYVIGSTNGTLYQFKNENGNLEMVEKIILPELENAYVRSISIIEDKLFTVSGPGQIYQYDLEEFSVEKQYRVSDEMYGMNQITKIDDTYFITVNTDKEGNVDFSTIVTTDDLAKLETGEYNQIYETMGFVGQPYFITYFDNRYWITEISAQKGNGIKSFAFENGSISDVKTLFYWDEVIEQSAERWQKQNNLYAGETVDLFVFAGQSNMSGKGDASQAPNVEKGYEFRAISDATQLYPIQEPFGIYENNPVAINDTTDEGEYRKLRRNGSFFCKCLL